MRRLGLVSMMGAVVLLAAACIPYDFDRDGRADYGYVDGQGRFWIEGQDDPIFVPPVPGTPVPGNYHGHLPWEPAVVTEDGQWHIAGEDEPRQFGPQDLEPDGDCLGWQMEQWIPVPGNYDPDTPTWELAWYQSCDAIWYIEGQEPVQFGLGTRDPSATPTGVCCSEGLWADIPVPADYDFDGTIDIAVFRVLDGTYRTLEDGIIADFSAVGRPMPGNFTDEHGIEPALLAWHHGGWLVDGLPAELPSVLDGTDFVVAADFERTGREQVRGSDGRSFWSFDGQEHHVVSTGPGGGDLVPSTLPAWALHTTLQQVFVESECWSTLWDEDPLIGCPPGVDPPTWPYD